MTTDLSDASLSTFLDAARLAVLRATEVCRLVQSSLDQVRAITKDDSSPVTVADFAAQAVVAMTLRERLGSFTLFAEESSAFLRDPAHAIHLDAALSAARRVWSAATAESLLNAIDLGSASSTAPSPTGPVWTLDPIDGTKGFLRGHQYSICLALIQGRDPIVAALACPNLPERFDTPLEHRDPRGCLYLATASQKPTSGNIWCEPCSLHAAADTGFLQPVHRASRAEGHAPILVESFEPSHSRQDATSAIMRRVNAKLARDPARPLESPSVRIDSQCKYVLVARGQADVYLRLPSKRGYVEKIWDHASGTLVAQQAGCIVTDARGKPLDYSHGSELTHNRGIVVSTPALHAHVIAAIAELGMSEEAPTR